jgi:general secretion pathway protein L
MRETCLIRLLPNGADGVAMTAAWRSGETSVARGTLNEAAGATQGRRTVVVVPGQDVLLTAAIVPTRNRQRIATALPFLLEEQLANDVDELHFAVGQRAADGTVHTAVVAHDLMNAWLESLRAAGIEPDAMVPDVLAIPYNPAGWTVVREAYTTLVRTGSESGFTADNETFALFVQAALSTEDTPTPETVYLYDFRGEYTAEEIDPFGEAGVAVETPGDAAGIIELLGRQSDDAAAINLLQGRYSRREQLGKVLRPWWPAAALLAGVALINGTTRITEYFQLSHEAERRNAAIERIYRETFPDARRIVDVRAQMEDKLMTLRAGGSVSADGFLDLLGSAAASLHQAPGLEVQRLSYRDGHLDLAVTTGDLQGIDALKQNLAANARLEAEIQSATSRDGKVEARLQVKGRNP